MNILAVIEVINQMEVDGVIGRYAIGGAVGATFYLEPVATLDIDIFIALTPQPGELIVSLQPIFDYLAERGHGVEGEYVNIAGSLVQFLPPTGPLVEEGLEQAVTRDITAFPLASSPPSTWPPLLCRPAGGKIKRACYNLQRKARWTRRHFHFCSPATICWGNGGVSNDSSCQTHHELRSAKDAGKQTRAAPQARGQAPRGEDALARTAQ